MEKTPNPKPRNRREDLDPRPTEDAPGEDTMMAWVFDGRAEATDGCVVEPDGVCPHGHRSWLLVLGLV